MKFSLDDKWNYLNCSSHILQDILWLILQQRAKLFGLSAAVVAGLMHPLWLYHTKQTHPGHTHCILNAAALGSSHLCLGRVGALIQEGNFVSSLQKLQRCVSSS